MAKKNNNKKSDINRLGVNECIICKTGRKLDYPYDKAKKFTDLL